MMVLEPLLRVVRIAPRGLSWPRLVAVCLTFLFVPLAPPAACALEPAAQPSTSPDSGAAPTARPATSPAGVERVRFAAAIERLRARVGLHSVRVWTGGKRLVVQRPVFDSLGIRPNAGQYSGDAGAQPMIAWHEVRRIDVRGSNLARGAVLSGLAVAIPGGISVEANNNEEYAGLGVTILSMAAALTGGTIGAFSGHWSRVDGWSPPAPPPKQVASEFDTTRSGSAPLALSAPTPASGSELRRLDLMNPKRGVFANSPDAAMAVGLASSVVLPAAGVAIGIAASGAGEAGFVIGVGTGITVGPAIGLALGGRGDLAKKGMVFRGTACALAGAGVGVAASSHEDNAAIIMGSAAGLVALVSFIHDLAITPSAVAQGQPPRATLGVDARGRVVGSVLF